MPRLAILLPPLLALLGCFGVKSQVLPEEAVDFRRYHRIGIPPFLDKKGQGPAIAAAVDAAFQQAMYEPVDQKAVVKLLDKYKPDRDNGLGIEGLEALRSETGVDALIFGRMTPDWSAATITMVEASVGDPILHAVLRPRGRGKKVFASPDDVAQEFMRVYAQLR